MKKFLEILFWILTDTLLIFGLAFFPSIFSIFCFIATLLFAPIEEWQNLLEKLFKKSFKAVIIAICVALVIAKFPLQRVVNGIYDVINPAPTSSDFEVYFEDSSKTTELNNEDYNISTNEAFTTTSNKTHNVSSQNIDTENIETNSEYVFRTPSGKKYHFSETCGGQNSYEVSFDEAINDGLTPCKKCAE